jgi:polyisoprenoid-binding protein YceI
MKLMNIALAGTLAAALLSSCGGTPEPTAVETPKGLTGTFSIDNANSTVKWVGSMLAVGGVSLYEHSGTIQISKGELVFDDGKLVGGTVLIDMTTINPTDSAYQDKDGSRPTDLVGHLSSDDFFNVVEFPTAEFSVKQQGETTVDGTLVIRGTSQPESIENVTIEEIEGGIKATGRMVFNRQQFNVKFAMPVADKILSDDIALEFNIIAKS